MAGVGEPSSPGEADRQVDRALGVKPVRTGRATPCPNPTAHLAGVGEAHTLTTRVQARHRAAVRPLTPFTDLSDSVARTAGGAARTGAVAAAAGGLLVAVALPAGAAPAAAPSAVDASVASVAGVVPAAFGTTAPGVVSAPATATTLATTATFAAAPARPPWSSPRDRARRPHRRRRPVIASSVAESAVAVAQPAAVEVAAAPAPRRRRLRAGPARCADPVHRRRLRRCALRLRRHHAVRLRLLGLHSYVYRQVGVNIPRTANAQKQAAATISRAAAVPGDLVFFSNSGGGRTTSASTPATT